MAKVLLIVIDALTDRVMRPLMDARELPNFAAIREQGQMRTSTSIFPSITQACLSSIATGRYPRGHHILGGHWYLPDEEDEAYFGTDPDIIYHKGIDNFYQDFVVNLNGERLDASTIFQEVESAGLSAASLNFMFFKGDVEHEVNLPFLMKLIPGIDDDGMTVKGPQTLYLGEFVKSSGPGVPALEVSEGPENWFGFKDDNTARQLFQLAHEKSFPDFTLAYFPRNDYLSHSDGPEKGHYWLRELDAALGLMFEAYGGQQEFLDEICLIITGDHAQMPVKDDPEAAISLLSLLEGPFAVAAEGEVWDAEYDIMACPNLRAAQLYFSVPEPAAIERAIELLLADKRVDQVIWRNDVLGDGKGYSVAQKDGNLSFEAGNRAADAYENGWDWDGDLSVVDGRVRDGRLTFGDYPNAFERIAGILDSRDSGHLWITARSGYEFDTPMTGIHRGGGSHGSLHVGDSLSSLFLAGNCGDYKLPQHPRLIDIKPICLSILGVG